VHNNRKKNVRKRAKSTRYLSESVAMYILEQGGDFLEREMDKTNIEPRGKTFGSF